MSVKTEAVAIIAAVKDQQVASVTSVFDDAINQVNALAEDMDVASLQTQVSDLQAKLDAANEAFAADEESDAAELQGEKDKEALLEAKNAKLQKKIDAIMAALSTEE